MCSSIPIQSSEVSKRMFDHVFRDDNSNKPASNVEASLVKDKSISGKIMNVDSNLNLNTKHIISRENDNTTIDDSTKVGCNSLATILTSARKSVKVNFRTLESNVPKISDFLCGYTCCIG